MTRFYDKCKVSLDKSVIEVHANVDLAEIPIYLEEFVIRLSESPATKRP